jgi:hypothetical protein
MRASAKQSASAGMQVRNLYQEVIDQLYQLKKAIGEQP